MHQQMLRLEVAGKRPGGRAERRFMGGVTQCSRCGREGCRGNDWMKAGDWLKGTTAAVGKENERGERKLSSFECVASFS